jgi:regulation of enolase protein 1 (concanavalin A-like superfamily)
MAKPPITETIAAELTVLERVLLFCLASDTNWVKAGVTHSTAQQLVRNLVERNHATDFALTDQGRSVLDALIRKALDNG